MTNKARNCCIISTDINFKCRCLAETCTFHEPYNHSSQCKYISFHDNVNDINCTNKKAHIELLKKALSDAENAHNIELDFRESVKNRNDDAVTGGELDVDEYYNDCDEDEFGSVKL